MRSTPKVGDYVLTSRPGVSEGVVVEVLPKKRLLIELDDGRQVIVRLAWLHYLPQPDEILAMTHSIRESWPEHEEQYWRRAPADRVYDVQLKRYHSHKKRREIAGT